MALGGEVHDGVGLVLCKDRTECGCIAEIHLLKAVVRVAFEVGERLGVSGIRQLIEVDDGFAFFFNKQSN